MAEVHSGEEEVLRLGHRKILASINITKKGEGSFSGHGNFRGSTSHMFSFSVPSPPSREVWVVGGDRVFHATSPQLCW